MKERLTESHITKFCIDLINSIPNCYARKRIANMIRSGEPDVTGIINKTRLEIEFKKPDKKLSPLQKIDLKLWSDLGAITGVSHSVLETIFIIMPHITRDQIKAIKNYLIQKKRSVLLKDQIFEATDYIDKHL